MMLLVRGSKRARRFAASLLKEGLPRRYWLLLILLPHDNRASPPIRAAKSVAAQGVTRLAAAEAVSLRKSSRLIICRLRLMPPSAEAFCVAAADD